MVRFVNYFLTILILPLTALTGDYFSSFERRISGASNFVAVDPILDQDRELAGFVFSDAANAEVVVYDLQGGVRNRVAVSGRPVTTINLGYNRNNDLVIYVAEVQRRNGYSDEIPYLTKISLGSGQVGMISEKISFKALNWGIPTVEQMSLRFAASPSLYHQVMVSVMVGFETWDDTQGWAYTGIGSSSLFDGELNELEQWPSRSNTTIGDINGDRGLEIISATNYYHRFDYSDFNNPDYRGDYSDTRLLVSDQVNAEMYSRVISQGWTTWMRVGEFNSSYAKDELVYCGTADLNSGSKTVSRRTACYSIGSVSADEIWRYESATFTPEFVFNERKALVGFDRTAVKLIDYRVGSLIDSVELDRAGSTHRFFETSLEKSELNLVLIYGDTVVVNKFNAPTYTPSRATEDAELPRTFSLFQNHPNPFNSSTMISFDNEESQQLTLVVFNILGREIATLYSGITSPGYYQFNWDGLDETGHEQATGIYFAQLRSADQSQMIKLVLLK